MEGGMVKNMEVGKQRKKAYGNMEGQKEGKKGRKEGRKQRRKKNKKE